MTTWRPWRIGGGGQHTLLVIVATSMKPEKKPTLFAPVSSYGMLENEVSQPDQYAYFKEKEIYHGSLYSARTTECPVG